MSVIQEMIDSRKDAKVQARQRYIELIVKGDLSDDEKREFNRAVEALGLGVDQLQKDEQVASLARTHLANLHQHRMPRAKLDEAQAAIDAKTEEHRQIQEQMREEMRPLIEARNDIMSHRDGAESMYISVANMKRQHPELLASLEIPERI
jgi:hypothetical protein